MIPNTPTITPELVAEHGLKPDEYQRILKLIGREPTLHGARHLLGDVERALLLQVVADASEDAADQRALGHPGAGRERRRHRHRRRACACVFKMESHNHPSYIEPYQGAATGVGGIMRDVFTMGARPIACLNALRFGDPAHPKTRHLVSGVVAGIGGYGNSLRRAHRRRRRCGFHTRYDGNILVNAMAVGIAEADKIFYAAAAGVGIPIVYLGSKTGRDGIHGATMASAEFDDDSEEKRPTVQVGDPFAEKLLLEACLELMADGLASSPSRTWARRA